MAKSFTREQIITSIIALLILFGAFRMYQNLGKEDESKSPEIKERITNVITTPVEVGDKSVRIQTNGTLEAKERIEIVSQVQGIFMESDRSFKSGTYYNKGDRLVSIDNRLLLADLRSLRAQLLQSLTSILADLKFDHPESFEKWSRYTESFDVNQNTKPIPSFDTAREKAFINSKNILTQYYGIKAKEVSSEYYTIWAPFDGILLENMIDKGTMINVGQRLGTFISPYLFEVDLKVSPEELELLSVGKRIIFYDNQRQNQWTGKVSRINRIIDSESQSAVVTAQVSGKGLKEGMFLIAEIETRKIDGVAELERSLIQSDSSVFVVVNETLEKKKVEISHSSDRYVYVKGLTSGSMILKKKVPGAFDGMKVKVVE